MKHDLIRLVIYLIDAMLVTIGGNCPFSMWGFKGALPRLEPHFSDNDRRH